MAEPQIRVTVEDLETHDVQVMEVADDYVLVTAGICEVTYISTYPQKGTHVVTVKNAARGMKRDVPAEELSAPPEKVARLIDQVRRELRDDASEDRLAGARCYFGALHDIGAITEERARELDDLIGICPGHDDDDGRTWCAYCGDLPRDEEPGADA